MKQCHRFYMLGMGTSTHAALATKDLLMEMSGRCVHVMAATTFLDQQLPISKMDVVIVISQSGNVLPQCEIRDASIFPVLNFLSILGETADTIKALDYCKKKGAVTVGITNVSGSTICNVSFVLISSLPGCFPTLFCSYRERTVVST